MTKKLIKRMIMNTEKKKYNCDWCNEPKEIKTGICEKCARFPKIMTQTKNDYDVTELNQNELEQLRQAYFEQLLEMDEEVLGDIAEANEIPMENVIAHYGGISFVKEDFWCNI